MTLKTRKQNGTEVQEFISRLRKCPNGHFAVLSVGYPPDAFDRKNTVMRK